MADCADRLGPAFGSRPAQKSPDFGPARKSGISGDVVEEIRKSGFRDLGRKSYGGSLLDSGCAFSDVSVARFTGRSGDDGVRKLAGCADRRGSASESRPASGSPDFGLTRTSAMSGDIVGEIRKSGDAASDIPVARLDGGFRRQRGPEIDQVCRPAGVRVWESPRPQIAQFRADSEICDSRSQRRGNPDVGISGSRQEFAWGGSIRFRRRASWRLRRAF